MYQYIYLFEISNNLVVMVTAVYIHQLSHKYIKIQQNDIYSMVTMASNISIIPNAFRMMQCETGKENNYEVIKVILARISVAMETVLVISNISFIM